MSTLTEFLTGIADAIRGKTGTSAPIPAQDFATEIAAIQTGSATAVLTIGQNLDNAYLRFIDSSGQYIAALEGSYTVNVPCSVLYVNQNYSTVPMSGNVRISEDVYMLGFSGAIIMYEVYGDATLG